MIIANEEIKELIAEIPEGHQHLRTTIVLQDGREITFQEATMANMVRAYITVKTHPERNGLRLRGRRLALRKEGFAEWQLLEADDEPSR
jgi:allophanate hydrolase subunit 2